MAELKKEVQSLLKNLKSITKQTEKLAKKVDSVPKAKAKKARKATKQKARPARKKAVRKTAAKTARVPASDVVYKLIKRSKKGTDTANLISKTGFKEKKIRDIIYRLKKQMKIKSAQKGLYIAID